MKPSQLKPGMRVQIKSQVLGGTPRIGTVISHRPRNCGHQGIAIIRVDEFIADPARPETGDVSYSDYDVSRRVKPLEASAL